MSYLQPLEVVDRGSKTQPQVVENSNKFTQQDKAPMSTRIVFSVYCLTCLRCVYKSKMSS